MCWISLSKRNFEPIVAESGVKVVKFLLRNNGRLFAPYMACRYEIGKMKDSIMLRPEIINPEGMHTIREGYHSFEYPSKITEKECPNHMWYVLEYPWKPLCHNRIAWNCSFLSEAPYECVIPKGAKYYLNENHEIVSETIIAKKNHTFITPIEPDPIAEEIKKRRQKVKDYYIRLIERFPDYVIPKDIR